MNRILQYISDIDPIEMNYLDQVTNNMDDKEFNQFITLYVSRRQSSIHVLLLCLVWVIGFAGIHRFLLGQIGMGLLYLFTWGLCGVGTIIDAVSYKRLTAEANIKSANEVLMMMEGNFRPY